MYKPESDVDVTTFGAHATQTVALIKWLECSLQFLSTVFDVDAVPNTRISPGEDSVACFRYRPSAYPTPFERHIINR